MTDGGTDRPDGAPALHGAVASNTALRLVLAAERLFARHGIDGVSLRQIAAAAGTSNNSAVRYHFGTKADLLAAIFTFRLDELTRRRAALVERIDPADLRARVEAHLLPLVELAEAPDAHYVGFVEQLQRSGALDVFVAQGAVRRSHDRFLADVRRLLTALPEPARSMRIAHVQDLCVHLAAERERAVDRGDASVPLALYVSAAVDGIAGFLAAPASPETTGLLARHRRARPRAGLRLV